MKFKVWASVALFLLLCGAIVLFVLLQNKQPEQQNIPTSTASEITATSLKANNSTESCWLGFGGRVYDITMYIEKNAGEAAADELSKQCGTSIDALPKPLKTQDFTIYQIGILVP